MRLRPADFLIHINEIALPNRVDKANEIHDKIEHWVRKAIVDSNEVKSRGEAVNLFAVTVEVCLVMADLLLLSAV
jgi:hypothetical protein